MIDLGLEGKGALVSGAGFITWRAGHGRGSAMRLAAAGATVACVDIDEGRAKGTVDAIEEAGGQAFPIVADMTVKSEVERVVDEAATRLGSLDVCVDIIGGSKWDRIENVTDEDWDWVMLNNLTQVFWLFRAAGRRMAAQGHGGSLIALSSADGIAAAFMHSSYGAAKAGVMSLAKTFAHEFGRYGIRANTVAPGNVGKGNEDWPDDTWAVNSINPLAPPRGHDIANAVLFLASSLSERITGQTLVVDGGATTHELWGLTDAMLPQLKTGDYDLEG
jgi:3-oxoacyl-[acyl-carrier protein] reductase